MDKKLQNIGLLKEDEESGEKKEKDPKSMIQQEWLYLRLSSNRFSIFSDTNMKDVNLVIEKTAKELQKKLGKKGPGETD